MKIGDLVKQKSAWHTAKGGVFPASEEVGIIIDVLDSTDHFLGKNYSAWGKYLKNTVTVLWPNGKISEGNCGAALQVVEKI